MPAKVYFKDEVKGILKPELFDQDARQDANRLVSARVPSAQVRRYFGEVRALQARLASAEQTHGAEAFDHIKPYLGLLKAKAYYGRRNNKRGSDDMVTLAEVLTDCIDGVKDKKSFDAMVKYLEAVVAYFTPDSK